MFFGPILLSDQCSVLEERAYPITHIASSPGLPSDPSNAFGGRRSCGQSRGCWWPPAPPDRTPVLRPVARLDVYHGQKIILALRELLEHTVGGLSPSPVARYVQMP